MKAAVVDRYGPPEVVRVREVPDPVPKSGELLVRVRASAVSSGDARIRAARFPRGFGLLARPMIGVRRPRRPVLGSAFSGVVESVGVKASGFSVGDEVCGLVGLAMGAHAELVGVKVDRVVGKPAVVSHEDAAGVLFGGTTALQFLRDKAGVGPGQAILVNGASGAVGTSAVQLARHFGATVTAVTSTPNLSRIEALGADRVVDYTHTPAAELADRFDVVLDAVGNLSPRTGRPLLAEGGVLLLVVASLADTVTPRGRVKAGVIPEKVEDVAFLIDRVAEGSLEVVMDGILDLDDIAEAHRRIDSGRKVGNIVVRPGGPPRRP